MQTIKNIYPKSVANVYGFFLALVGFFTAIGIAVTNIVNIIMTEGFTVSALLVTGVFNLLMGVLIGLISAFAGFFIGYISGLILAWFYNLAVRLRLISGLKIEMD